MIDPEPEEGYELEMEADDMYTLCSDTTCKPLRTIEELLSFHVNPVRWCDLIEPIKPRCAPRSLGSKYREITTVNDTNNKFKLIADPPLENLSEVLVCHDFKGNYLEDKFIAGSSKWDDYRFYNWAGIDIFCYFSHHFITIPVPVWINAAHKNGVEVMGTFIVESGHGIQTMDKILSSREYMKQTADALAFISKYCKFEGWLLNVECAIKADKIPLLREFVEYLTQRVHEDVPKGRVIWYDSVTDEGHLSWQNELNGLNRIFFEACDGIFLNYNWSPSHLKRTDDLIMRHYPHLRKNVFAGIDVFGRGQVAEFDTHKTLAQIKHHDFSVAIFAPGWTHESLNRLIDTEEKHGTNQCNEMFIEKNDKFWNLLWQHLNTRGPTEMPFFTSFCIGSGKIKNRLGRFQRKSWFHLGRQEFQPSVPSALSRYFDNALDGGSSLKISEHPNLCSRLFVCDFKCNRDLIVAYAFKRNRQSVDLELVLHFYDNLTEKSVRVVCGDNELFDEFGLKNIIKLDGNDVKNITINLGNKKERHLPGSDLINGWEIRYFYLSFESSENKSLVDIGVRGKNELGSGAILLLGALAVHQGRPDGDADLTALQSTKITEEEFH